MKIAKVVPLFKAGDKSKFTNYRPVSLLPQFSKVFEMLYCNILIKSIDNHDVSLNSQYSFRNKYSVNTNRPQRPESRFRVFQKYL